MSLLRRSVIALAALLALLAGDAAWGEAAKVVFAVGDVAALRGTTRVPLAAGATLEAGDTIVTAAQSHAQLRFTDDALVALKPDSEFRIEQYNFDGRQDGTEIAVFRLVKGGFRTLTGQIGKISPDHYQLLTTQATIGIRGTHYQVQLCAPEQCREGEAAVRAGMYGGVYEGRIAVANVFGSNEFGADEFFFVPDGEAPQRFLGPPSFLSDKLKTKGTTANAAPGDMRVANPLGDALPDLPLVPYTYLATEDLNLVPFPANLAGPLAVIVGSDVDTLEFEATTDPALHLSFNRAGQLVGFVDGSLSAQIGTASLVDAGQDNTADGLHWGRWQGTGSSIAQTLGSTVVHNDGGNLHYIYGVVATALPGSGEVQYGLVGGTRPTDSGTGQVGTLLSGGIISVNFTTAQLALAGLSAGFGSATYTLNGTASIVNGGFSTASGGATGACSGAGCQTLIAGNFLGFLAGPGGTGIGLDYYFNTRGGSVLEGVAGYRQCPGGKC
jgi:FecR protein